MPRCKNGTRRNKKTGKCEKPKRRLRSNTKRTRRCPNGTRRIPPKTGQCVKRSKKVSVTDAQKKKQWDKLVKLCKRNNIQILESECDFVKRKEEIRF